MSKKVNILPNDQSFIGMKVRIPSWPNGGYCVVKYVGHYSFIADNYLPNSKLQGEVYFFNEFSTWELYEEPIPYRSYSPLIQINPGDSLRVYCTGGRYLTLLNNSDQNILYNSATSEIKHL